MFKQYKRCFYVFGKQNRMPEDDVQKKNRNDAFKDISSNGFNNKRLCRRFSFRYKYLYVHLYNTAWRTIVYLSTTYI